MQTREICYHLRMNVISWNVNGIRAAEKKGLVEFIQSSNADIVCIQETKAHKEQLPTSLIAPEGYHSYWNSAEKKGYSGTAIYSKVPLSVEERVGKDIFDIEGRVLIANTQEFTLINAYFPNSQEKGKRLSYKLEFCNAMRELCNSITQKKQPLILCGDYNIAHTEIDLARPKENEESPGYLPQERAWMDSFISEGYTDTFRHFCKEPQHYTWWSYRAGARSRNVGWRIDYFCTNAYATPLIKESTICSDVMGSDHCPIQLIL